jgi:hypothetical protein
LREVVLFIVCTPTDFEEDQMRIGRLAERRAVWSVALAAGLLASLFQPAPAGATFPGQNTDLYIVAMPSDGSAAGLLKYDETGMPATGGGARCGDAGTGLTLDTTSRIWVGATQLGTGSFITCIQQSGGGSIYFIPSDFSNAVEVTFFDGDHKDPAVSPDGTRLLFASSAVPDGVTQICAAGLDGSNKVCFDNPGPNGSAWAPVWNPADDQQFVFVSDSDGDPDLYLYDLRTNQAGPLTENDVPDYGPDYSPDGSRIVFSSRVNGRDQIFWMTQADREPMQLTTDTSHDNFEPVFSPEGDLIAYSKQDPAPGSESRVYLMTASGAQRGDLIDQQTGNAYDHAEWRQDASGSGGCEPNCGNPVEERTFVSFRLTKHLTAKGVLGSGGEFGLECVEGETVTIQRKKGARWVRVTTTRTGDSGAFSTVIADRTGTYRARVAESEQGAPDEPVICEAATSRTARHSH